MNVAESAAVERLFVARGWTPAPTAQTADMAIINTCSVRQTAENRIFGRLGWYRGLKAVRAGEPGAKDKSLGEAAAFVRDGARPLTLVVMGCMAERLLTSFQADFPVIDYVVGTFAKQQFGDIITAVEERRSAFTVADAPTYTFAPLSYKTGSFTSYVPIMHGCNQFCTFCIVPHVRGREVSRPVKDIMAEIDALSQYGVREITLLGQTVDAYYGETEQGSGQYCDFAALLETIAAHLRHTKSSIGWVRFLSSHPNSLNDAVIEAIATHDVLCPHIHLAVQHGSDDILKRMNRRYTVSDYLAVVERIRARIPQVSLTTDIMVGFPGETDADVQLTLDLMERVRYENAFMYYYNPREGTPAARFTDQVSVKEKKQRLSAVIALQKRITKEEMHKRLGTVTRALVESVSRDSTAEVLAKTPQDERVAFAADKRSIGEFVTVRLDTCAGETFRGTRVS